MGLLTDRINHKLEKSNLINEHALNREPVKYSQSVLNWISRKGKMHMFCFFRRKFPVDDLKALRKTNSNTANFNRFAVE